MTYAETHAKLLQAKRDGVAEIRVEIDPGEFTVTVDEALEMFDDLAPGEWFEIVPARQPIVDEPCGGCGDPYCQA